MLGVPRPDPSVPDEAANRYVFDKAVTFQNPDGKISTGSIDLYRKGAFVCETKQSVARPERDPLSVADPAAPKARRKTGTSVRGTAGWDDSMIAARGQAEGSVRALPDDNPPFLLVIDIGHSFELYADFSQLGKVYSAFPDARSHHFSLADLRDIAVRERLTTLWLDPLALDPARHSAKVTREIAARIAVLARWLEAKTYDPEQVAWFLIRCLFTFFSEDVCLTPRGGFTSLLESLKESPEQFVPLVSEVWKTMGQGGFSTALRTRIKQFKGSIFREHDPLPLDAEEISLLIDAGKSDWRDVEPAIFGTLLERALDPRERHKLGAHFTPRAYVERLVVPTIIEPVRDDWEAARAASLAEANAGRIDQARAEARDWLAQLGETQTDLEHMERTVDPQQFLGIEINPRAVAIAEVVLWIGWLQWHLRDRKSPDSFSEPILQAYGNIECRDALLEYDRKELVRDESGKPVTRWDGVTMKKHPVTGVNVPDDSARAAAERYVNPRKAEWPKADFVVGNPPFLGKLRIQSDLGEGYADALRKVYSDEVPDSADYVMYWWDRGARLVSAGAIQRFGFITTNSITQAFNRRIVANALSASVPCRVVFAVPDHPWVATEDGAAVRIAMTVGAQGVRDGSLNLVIAEQTLEDIVHAVLTSHRGSINADLSVGVDVTSVVPLASNRLLASMGPMLGSRGFAVTAEKRTRLVDEDGPETASRIMPLRNGKDLLGEPRGIFAIDLQDLDTADEVRRRLPATYQHLHNTVLPDRIHNKDAKLRTFWWKFRRSNVDFREMLADLPKFVVTVETAKYRAFVVQPSGTLCEHGTISFGLQDAFFLGVMTITGMYNVLEKLRSGEPLTAKEKTIHDDGLVSVLKKIHDDLDAAVFDAYGWPATLSDDEILERLVALNHERAAEEKRGLIRWLRPEFQNKDGAGMVQQTIDPADDDETDGSDEPAAEKPKRGRLAAKKSAGSGSISPKVAKQAWPKDLAEQTRAVRAALTAAGGIATAADVAGQFKHAKTPRVEEILDTLAALGHARRADDGYASA